MKLILFGATGMVGAGTLREALADPGVAAVLSVGRRACGVQHPKLSELLLPDLFDFASVETELVGWDACAWSVGVSSIGLDEPRRQVHPRVRRHQPHWNLSPSPWIKGLIDDRALKPHFLRQL